MWRWITLGIVAAGTALLIILTLAHEPAVTAVANGTFANDCCGTVKLSHGNMLLNDQHTVRYIVARDADGPYILPHAYVGVVPYQGFDVDGTRSVIKLRLDRLPAPTRMTLYEGLSPYVFTRQAPRSHKQ